METTPESRTILIINDAEGKIELIRSVVQTIREEQMDILEFTDGIYAVKHAEQNPNFFGAVVDWEMNIMHGPETIEALRAINQKAIIVLATATYGKKFEERAEKALALGANSVASTHPQNRNYAEDLIHPFREALEK